MADDDIHKLLEIRRQVLMLELHADPLLSGLLAQLVGIIDALIGIAEPPHPHAPDALVQAKR